MLPARSAGILEAVMKKTFLAAVCVGLLLSANCLARQEPQVALDASRLELQGQFK